MEHSSSRSLPSKEDGEDDWAHFEDPDAGEADEDVPVVHSPLEFTNLPSNLHPAVSLGAQRVSSCYFSLNSEHDGSFADLLSQLNSDEASLNSFHENPSHTRPTRPASLLDVHNDGADVLYHDILMNVFTFFDNSSLTAFSETARRPNFEVFYFLQLQLQRALIVPKEDENGDTEVHLVHNDRSMDPLTAIAGSTCLSRLAQLDLGRAQAVVDEYLQSNSTLRTLPLSHSLAYFRHVLRRRGFHGSHQQQKSTHALASAALLVTVVGAAVMTGSTPRDAAALADSLGATAELPNMLFGVGFMGSALMASRKMSSEANSSKAAPNNDPDDLNTNPASMRETAEQMARTLQDIPSTLMRQQVPEQFPFPSLIKLRRMLNKTLTRNNKELPSGSCPAGLLPNPYDHLPSIDEQKQPKEEELKVEVETSDATVDRKMPSGSVGAYSRAVHRAASGVASVTKERHKALFLVLPEEDQRQLSLTFLDACSSDGTLSLVQEMIQTMDVDGFFTGSDGAETCGLHTAAFHGATEVIDFLCRGIDYGEEQKAGDGGLCDINARDSNGWTALHFAAGANAVAAVQTLALHGAHLDVEANNGYTPLQWALRLSNEQVANQLKEELAGMEAETPGWMSSQPLTQIANSFFSLIPSH